MDCISQEEGGQQEKLIVKKEKALKAREEELRRNLQKLEELGEDVAAITGTGTTPQSEAEVSEAQPTADVILLILTQIIILISS